MESFFSRYRNLVVLLAALLAQVIGLATQVRHPVGKGSVSGSMRGMIYDEADPRGVRLIRLWAVWMVTPAERVMEAAESGVQWFWGDYLDLRHTRQQNKDLRQTIDRLRLEQAALLEDARQGERLQALLGFQEKYIYQTLAAQVIGASGSEQSKIFYLDKGSADGLKPDMAVINGDGIVGKIREVFPHSAQVLLINDQASGAGVILEKTRIRGILRGNADGQPEVIDILSDQRIQPGERVLTAGGDQIFPRGLPVGVVQKVIRDPDRDGFIHVVVKPAANLERLDEVLVITLTEARMPPQQQADIATSEALKGAQAALEKEQAKAAALMAERLPGLTDPNATHPADGATAGQEGGNAAPVDLNQIVVPRPQPTLHPDRFTPGAATPVTEPSGPASESAMPEDKATQPGKQESAKPDGKTGTKTGKGAASAKPAGPAAVAPKPTSAAPHANATAPNTPAPHSPAPHSPAARDSQPHPPGNGLARAAGRPW